MKTFTGTVNYINTGNDQHILFLNTEESIAPQEPIIIPREFLKQAFKEANLGLNLKDSEAMADLVFEYIDNKSLKLYNRLPHPLKLCIDSIYGKSVGDYTKPTITKEEIAKFIIDGIIDDGEFKAIMKQFNDEMNEYTVETSKEMINLFSDAYNEIFNKIDEIREEDPERADLLQSVKDAFEDAKNFNRQIEFLKSEKPRIVRKYHRRVHAITDTFNNLVNATEIKLPNINELYDIIKLRLPQYSKDQINEFIILICKSTMNLDFSILANIAYVYKLVDSIYKFKFVAVGYEDEESNRVFGAISDVIEEIQVYKQKEGGSE